MDHSPEMTRYQYTRICEKYITIDFSFFNFNLTNDGVPLGLSNKSLDIYNPRQKSFQWTLDIMPTGEA